MIHNTDEIIEGSIKAAREHNLIKAGDTVVICAGIPSGKTSMTNMMKVEIIS
jgi:pyruvate kinase